MDEIMTKYLKWYAFGDKHEEGKMKKKELDENLWNGRYQWRWESEDVENYKDLLSKF